METALRNPVFDSPDSSPDRYQYTRLLTPTDSQTDNTDQKTLLPERTIDLQVLDSGDRYEEINSIAAAVLQLYRPVEARKDGIRKNINGFKEALGVSKESAILHCFKVLRERFSPTTKLELVCAGWEPIKLKVTDFTPSTELQKEVDSNTKKAITLLNSCLNQCQKYCGEKELRIADIEVRLEDLQLMPLTREGQSLYAAVNKIPSYIEELSTDISTLLQEMYEARYILRPQ